MASTAGKFFDLPLRVQDKQLVALGEQLLTSSAPLVPHTQADIIAAARAHLAGREGQDIRLRELPMLLADFKRCLEPSGESLSDQGIAYTLYPILPQITYKLHGVFTSGPVPIYKC